MAYYMELILGSQSPRRKEILHFFSLPFKQVPSAFDESQVAFQGNPTSYAMELAQKKAESLQALHPGAAILTADTVVFCNQKIYNKPVDRKQAELFLQELSNRWHSVFTALTLSFLENRYSAVQETKILFHPLDSNQIRQYLDHINFLDKAGSYAIQQGGSILIKQIDGCYYNVMGLPITALKDLLSKIGIDLWDHLKIL
jgi:septum formation protein